MCRRATAKTVTIRGPSGETIDIDTSGLKTNEAETLRQWSEISMSDDIPGPIQELMKRMALESNAPINKEQILQHVTDWF